MRMVYREVDDYGADWMAVRAGNDGSELDFCAESLTSVR